MPPPRRKHPIRKPPPPKPASAARPSSTTTTAAVPSAAAIKEANEAAELQNAVMSEQIMKSDAPQVVKDFVTRPDYKVDIRAWNKAYEAYLVHLWGPESKAKRIDLDKVQEYDSWASGPAILNREAKRRNVRDYGAKLAQIVLHSELKQAPLLDKWRNLTQDEREQEFFASMKTMTDNGSQASQTRNEVPEITLARMTDNNGQGFIDLVNHFVDNFKKNLTDPSFDIFQPLQHKVYDRVYMHDRSEDAPPLPKGVRAFQEEMLLDRHLYMILFAIGILLKLNGIKIKFTQPAESEHDKDDHDDDDPVDGLELEQKLSLADRPSESSSKPNMSQVRQHPLTAGLLRQLSDFTSEVYYHVYYTDPVTGQEKKQPLTFKSNREAIQSFLPIRNAAIQARDDRACGLLCAILIEGCVDDYAGGQVTEQMVANQMKLDFEWTDEQLGELVPPEYVLVQLDVVPDLPQVVQAAETQKKPTLEASETKDDNDSCNKESCASHHHH
ncbi:uncharacterized protein JCM15063_006336 [Sporobolomyces koalae]|uniref:uncharacterized protein n=1 Tax=Sporobolomyces koalae TaxID=500713 RepID=UPI00317A8272